jgi:hypothetical protein
MSDEAPIVAIKGERIPLVPLYCDRCGLVVFMTKVPPYIEPSI